MRKKLITFALPCYNEEFNVAPAYESLRRVAKKHPRYAFEYVFVDNRSLDRTREEITKLAKKDKNVVGVYLSRNFGPEGSIQAGLDTARGDAVIIYESDMQDPPEVIHQFINKWEAGFDAVVGVRTKIEDNAVMTFFRKTFYKVFKSISNIEVPVNAGSFALIDRKVLKAINALPEKYRFHRGLRAWVGFKTDYVTYERRARTRGKSSYTLYDYFHHAERSFFGFSYLPLDLIVYFGFVLVGISFLSFLYAIGYYMVYQQIIEDHIMILLGLLFFGGIQMLAISTVGKYIQVIVEETKSRPMYLIEEITNKRIRNKQ